ncbi:MAG: purine-nucleoside phosphorylase [Candidatus Eiseniibacteriota bacterium]
MSRADVDECVAVLRNASALVPRIGIVLGSGLGGVADRVVTGRDGAAFSTAELPHWPASTVHGHEGKLVLGRWEDTPVVVLRGRTHVYEGYPLERVTFAHRVMAALGIHTLLVTNAVGTFNTNFAPGDLMLVRDHINGIGKRGLLTAGEIASNPPLGRGVPAPAVRAYTPRVAAVLRASALELGILLREGILLAGTGPAYETAAEIRMARKLGADAACMSSAHEIDLAAALGLSTGAVSCITNYGTGLSPHPLTHADVQEVAGRVASRLEALLARAIGRL